jgi:hypothetical protein
LFSFSLFHQPSLDFMKLSFSAALLAFFATAASIAHGFNGTIKYYPALQSYGSGGDRCALATQQRYVVA